MRNQKTDLTADLSSSNLTAAAESELRSLSFWAKMNWSMHNWFVALSLVGALVTPFGIAALPYLDPAYSRPVNLVLVIVSATSLVLQFLNLQLRLPQRARHARQRRDNLSVAIADFKDGAISRSEFKALFAKILEDGANEEPA